MSGEMIVISIMNVVMFLLSVLYFRNGKKAYAAATARHAENMAALDKIIAEATAVNSKHKEIGELLTEVQELAEGIKSGKVKYVP
jgi:hypothetical protein